MNGLDPELAEFHRLALERWQVLVADDEQDEVIQSVLSPYLGSSTVAMLRGHDDDARDALRDLQARDAFGRLAKQLSERLLAVWQHSGHEADASRVSALQGLCKAYISSRNRLLAKHMGLVRRAIKRFRIDSSRRGDAMQDGVLGLVRALECFRPDKGTRFSTYAVFWVRTAILRGAMRQSQLVHVPFSVRARAKAYDDAWWAAGADLSSDERRRFASKRLGLTAAQERRVDFAYEVVLGSDLTGVHIDEPTFDMDIHLRDQLRGLVEGLRHLGPLERHIIDRRFELDGHERDTLRRLGQSLRCSGERVRQVEKQALDKLRHHLGGPVPRAAPRAKRPMRERIQTAL